MKNLKLWAGAVALALPVAPVAAQTYPTAPLFKDSAGRLQEGIVNSPCVKQVDGSCVAVSAANPMPVTSSGGGGGAATVADGADVAEGSKADAKSLATDTTPASMIALSKGQVDRLSAIATALTGQIALLDGAAPTFTAGTSNNAVLFSADTIGYGGVGVQLSGTWSATVTFQWSNDNTNWVSAQAQSGQSFVSTTTVNGLFYVPAQYRYVRALVSPYTSGTVSGVAYQRKISVDPASNTVTLGAGGNTAGVFYPTLGVGASSGAPLSNSYILSSAATTNSNLISSGTRRLIGGQICNNNASIKQYVKLYNKATAPTVGTDTPLNIFTLAANSCASIEPMIGNFGEYFNLGLGIGITGAFASSDTTAVAANDVTVNLLYL